MTRAPGGGRRPRRQCHARSFAVALWAAVASLALAAAACASQRSAFVGSCRFSGPISPTPAITVLPRAGPHFSYSGVGTCDGALDAAQVKATPLTVGFTNVATIFDTCELGPDFDLHGLIAIGPAGKRALFDITVNLARLALAGPLALTTPGGGRAVGVAQFDPADPSSAPQRCATTGVGAASLAASFDTLSALTGTPERQASPAAHSTAPISRGGAASSAPAVCAGSRHARLRLHAPSGERIVALAVYLDGRLTARRHGRRLRSATLPPLAVGRHDVRIVLRLARGVTRVERLRYANCARR